MSPRISVFTPSHDPRWLEQCYASLTAQSFTDWEWVVLTNGPRARGWLPPPEWDHDARVRVFYGEVPGAKVGAAKAMACDLCTGQILVELDHDDLLLPPALEQIDSVFRADPNLALVYSDFAQINADGTPNGERFNAAHGWVYDEVDVDGVAYLRCQALEPSPHNVGLIWYAPNHVRAFGRALYERVGGYAAQLEVLDDQDLMARLYQAGEFCHIPELLYLQRVHEDNTQKGAATNAYIQEQTRRVYDASIEDLARAWARRAGLAVITLRTPSSPVQLIREDDEVIEIDPVEPKLPFTDGEVGLIKAVELLQRLPSGGAALFNECHRVLAHGGLIDTLTPSTDGRGAFQDPSHVSYWNQNSFWYITDAGRAVLALPGLHVRMQLGRLHTFFPTAFDTEHDIAYVSAVLIAIKDGPRQGGWLTA